MTNEKIVRSEDATEAYRELASRFMRELGCPGSVYVGAVSGQGIVYLRIRVLAEEIGEPKTNSLADVDVFEKTFRERYADALSVLPEGVKLTLELKRDPNSEHVLTLYP